MKAELRPLTSTPDRSFLIRTDIGQNLVNNWHYHPEIELLYIKRSAGTWLVASQIGALQARPMTARAYGEHHTSERDGPHSRKYFS